MSVLFSHGRTDYVRVKTLPQGPYPQQRYLCVPRTANREGALVEVAVLPPSAHPRDHARLEEAALWGLRLLHPALPRTHGLYRDEGHAFLVTEYVSGFSMNMAGHYGCMRQRPLSEPFTLHVASQVAAALGSVHGLTDSAGRPSNVIHGGVDPYNILLGTDGRVMLTGFTTVFSRHATLPRRSSQVLRSGLDFAAPERLCPERGEGVDGRADFFSLGLVMLELTTGQQLYAADEVERAAALLPPSPSPRGTGSAPPPERSSWTSVEQMARRAAAFQPEHLEHLMGEVSAPVRRIIHRLLRRRPSERYATAAELKAELDACLREMGEPHGPAQALAELLEARREAEEKGPEDFFASDEAERGALLALKH
jgi:eukaryotic-like serine/threonine-protein kinase